MFDIPTTASSHRPSVTGVTGELPDAWSGSGSQADAVAATGLWLPGSIWATGVASWGLSSSDRFPTAQDRSDQPDTSKTAYAVDGAAPVRELAATPAEDSTAFWVAESWPPPRRDGLRPRDTRSEKSAASSQPRTDESSDESVEAAWWAALPGGVELAAALGDLNPAELSDYDLIDFISASERVKAWSEAAQYSAIAVFARRRPAFHPHDAGFSVGPPTPTGELGDDEVICSEFATDELALALTITTNAADFRLRQALDLAVRVPDTVEALRQGRIDGVRARAIADALTMLPTTTARRVERDVLPTAGDKTPSALRRALSRAILKADPAAARARHTKAVADRKVVHYSLADGMATLGLTTVAWQALACYHALDADARTAKAAGDRRSMNALRADALVARILGICGHHSDHAERRSASDVEACADRIDEAGAYDPECCSNVDDDACPHDDACRRDDTRAAEDAELVRHDGQAADDTELAHQATPCLGQSERPSRRKSRRTRGAGRYLIQVVVPITALLGCDDQPAHLTGHGPIPTDLAREIAADPDSVWHRLLTDPVSGALLDYGNTVYHPPPALARFVTTRDQDCRLPVCAVSARRCDFHHSIPFHLGGPTAAHNGGPACRHHHRAAQQPGWQLDQDPDTSIFTWTTPSGHTYRAYPARFDESGEDQPSGLPDHLRQTESAGTSDDAVADGSLEPPEAGTASPAEDIPPF